MHVCCVYCSDGSLRAQRAPVKGADRSRRRLPRTGLSGRVACRRQRSFHRHRRRWPGRSGTCVDVGQPTRASDCSDVPQHSLPNVERHEVFTTYWRRRGTTNGWGERWMMVKITAVEYRITYSCDRIDWFRCWDFALHVFSLLEAYVQWLGISTAWCTRRLWQIRREVQTYSCNTSHINYSTCHYQCMQSIASKDVSKVTCYVWLKWEVKLWSLTLAVIRCCITLLFIHLSIYNVLSKTVASSH